MGNQKITERRELNALQIAGLAIVGSTLAAVATLIAVRRWGLVRRPKTEAEGSMVPRRTNPGHFSEDAIIPGFTYTGAEVEEQDSQSGRSSEGV